MNNLVWKVYNHKKLKWNILILVILVMLTVAMMWLLTMSFLKQMFNYTINLDGYYKSYYLSKAWIELALTEIDNSDVGFSNRITGPNNIFTQNLCAGMDCSVDLTIMGGTKNLSEEFWDYNGCDKPIVLSGGESFALPLFLQQYQPSNVAIISGSAKDYTAPIASKFGEISVVPMSGSNDIELNLSLVFPDINSQLENLYIGGESFSKDMFSKFYEHAKISKNSLDKDKNDKLYLMISNPTEDTVSFCLTADFEIPATKFYVISLWNYNWKYVWMQAIYAQPIPSFMFYGYHGSAPW